MNNLNYITLSEDNFLASGCSREVYSCPKHPRLLIKISIRYTRHKLLTKPLYKTIFRSIFHSATNCFVREIIEFFRVNYDSSEYPSYLQRIVGLCHTNFGFGMIVEAVIDEHGQYAKTLDDYLSDETFSPAMLTKLEEFMRLLLASPIVIYDLNFNNILYGYDKESRSYHFVLVDGTAEKAWIPLRRIISCYNKHKKKHLINDLRSKVHMILKRQNKYLTKFSHENDSVY